jgi:hypothetical protein
MAEPLSLLMLEFLTWVSSRSRSYDEAMEAWRSSCPRQTIWEDAIIEGFIEVGGRLDPSKVTLTARGKEFLDTQKALQLAQRGAANQKLQS